MAKNTEGLDKIRKQIPDTKPLSYDWLNQEPKLEDYGLESYNLTAIYNNRERFEKQKPGRIAAEKQNQPESPRGQFSWEGWVASALAVVMLIYQFAAKNPSPAIFGAIAILTIAFFAMCYLKYRRKMRAYEKETQAIAERIQAINREQYKYQNVYDSMAEYAYALHDYEAWNQRRDPSFWKTCREDMLTASIISMLGTMDMLSDASDIPGISILFEKDGESCCVFTRKKAVMMEDVKKMLSSMEEEDISNGYIGSPAGINQDAERYAKDHGLKVWSLEDLLKLEEAIENR